MKQERKTFINVEEGKFEILILKMRNFIRLAFLVPGIFLCIDSCAQQDPMYSQYMFDPLAINPAFAGSKNNIFSAITYRNQFVSFPGAPVTQKLTFNAPLQKRYMGLGLKAFHDIAGTAEITSLSGIYSYYIGLGKGKLSFGLEGGLTNFSVDYTNLIRTHPDDLALSYSKESKFLPDASFGMYYYHNRFYFGLAMYHLFQSKVNLTQYERNDAAKLFRHEFLSSGYKIKASEKIDIEPSVLLKYVSGSSPQADLNTNVIWNEIISIGGSYRTGDGLSFLFRYLIREKIVIGYSYDLTLSGLSKYSNGSHEIMAGYQVKLLPPATKKITDPRYYF